MRSPRSLCCGLAFLAATLVFAPAHAKSVSPREQTTGDAIQLALDSSEAEACLRILDKENTGQTVTDADWQALFSSEPYQWLIQREASFGRSLGETAFRNYLTSSQVKAKAATWRATLEGMKGADMEAIGRQDLAWLPPGATIRARVFLEIKPTHNSFVWTKPGQGRAIFLNVESQTRDQFENTVAHELHHIGLSSLEARQDQLQSDLPDRVRLALKWMSAFGEGEAMLAAAGSADRHPHWVDDALTRARWDADMMHFGTDLGAVQDLITDILDGKLTSDAEIQKRAAPFWGVQGAWYTVGYEMAALVEKQYGRATFNDCLLDPRKLLLRYNEVAIAANRNGASLATWSPDLLRRLQATS